MKDPTWKARMKELDGRLSMGAVYRPHSAAPGQTILFRKGAYVVQANGALARTIDPRTKAT